MVDEPPAQPDGQERRRDAVGEAVVEPPEPQSHDLVLLEPQAAGGFDVDGDHRRAQQLELGVEGQGQEILDRPGRAQVATVVVVRERAAAGTR